MFWLPMNRSLGEQVPGKVGRSRKVRNRLGSLAAGEDRKHSKWWSSSLLTLFFLLNPLVFPRGGGRLDQQAP